MIFYFDVRTSDTENNAIHTFFFNFTSMTWLKASAKLHIIMYIYILSSLSQGFLVHSICVRIETMEDQKALKASKDGRFIYAWIHKYYNNLLQHEHNCFF